MVATDTVLRDDDVSVRGHEGACGECDLGSALHEAAVRDVVRESPLPLLVRGALDRGPRPPDRQGDGDAASPAREPPARLRLLRQGRRRHVHRRREPEAVAKQPERRRALLPGLPLPVQRPPGVHEWRGGLRAESRGVEGRRRGGDPPRGGVRVGRQRRGCGRRRVSGESRSRPLHDSRRVRAARVPRDRSEGRHGRPAVQLPQ